MKVFFITYTGRRSLLIDIKFTLIYLLYLLVYTKNKEKLVTINDGTYTIQSNFDEVFSQNATQQQVFQSFGRVIPQIFIGYNVTFFAYGQTGSGIF